MGDITQVNDLFIEAISVALRLAAPVLLLCMIVGVVMAIFQAVTQIHEQSLAFILKLVVVITYLIVGGGWMLRTLQEFSLGIFAMM